MNDEPAPEPLWPPERDITRYAELLGFDPRDRLSSDSTWLDIGCRSGRALAAAATCAGRVIGLNDREIATRPGVEARVATLPQDHAELAELRGACRLITDIYGAFAYADDPVVVLAHELALLAPGGRLAAVFLPAKFPRPEDLEGLLRGITTMWGFVAETTVFENTADINGRTIQVARLRIDRSASEPFIPEDGIEQFRRSFGKTAPVGVAWRSADGTAVQRSVVFASPEIAPPER